MRAARFDVGIVGGGIIGCAVAYYLSKGGASVALLERSHLCSGASSANQGGMAVQIFDLKTIPLTLASARLYSGLADEIGYDVEYRRTGSLLVAREDYQVPLLRQRYKDLTRMGMEVDFWDPERLGRFPGGDVEPFRAVLESPVDCQVNPFRTTYGFALAAERLGARILTGSTVREIRPMGKREYRLDIEGGAEILCGHVVCAAGPWSRRIGRMVGLDIPVEPQRGQLIITEQVPEAEYPYILDGDYLATAYGIEARAEDERARKRLALGIGGSFAQHASGNWTIGASRDMAGFVSEPTLEVLRALARHLLGFLPEMKEVNCIRFIAGWRPYCMPDGHPILGRVLGLPGFSIATGHAGEGVALAPITGKLIAEEITTGRTSLSLDDFRYERLSASG
ncbi:MAG: FAD-binding oxidoreductase [Deltaproteobacteria bacterium]|nr:FAD-binding oxidoreductase [Deltaproteobacteria bacterium]